MVLLGAAAAVTASVCGEGLKHAWRGDHSSRESVAGAPTWVLHAALVGFAPHGKWVCSAAPRKWHSCKLCTGPCS